MRYLMNGAAIQISVRRNYLYEDAFEKLSRDNGMKFCLRRVGMWVLKHLVLDCCCAKSCVVLIAIRASEILKGMIEKH